MFLLAQLLGFIVIFIVAPMFFFVIGAIQIRDDDDDDDEVPLVVELKVGTHDPYKRPIGALAMNGALSMLSSSETSTKQ